MGCDIHIVIETKTGGRWVGIATDLSYVEINDTGAPVRHYPIIGMRNYAFFGRINGVRTQMPHGLSRPRQGIPEDCSDLTNLRYGDGADWHSAASLPLWEFAMRYFSEDKERIKRLAALKLIEKEGPDRYNYMHAISHMLVVAACGAEVDIHPDVYNIDTGDKLIAFVNENFRAVFWFDN